MGFKRLQYGLIVKYETASDADVGNAALVCGVGNIASGDSLGKIALGDRVGNVASIVR